MKRGITLDISHCSLEQQLWGRLFYWHLILMIHIIGSLVCSKWRAVVLHVKEQADDQSSVQQFGVIIWMFGLSAG